MSGLEDEEALGAVSADVEEEDCKLVLSTAAVAGVLLVIVERRLGGCRVHPEETKT